MTPDPKIFMVHPCGRYAIPPDMRGQKITVFGFGSQGRAQTLNARDSGWKVAVYLRPESKRIAEAQKEKLAVMTDPKEAAQKTDIAVFLLPPPEQPPIFKNTF